MDFFRDRDAVVRQCERLIYETPIMGKWATYTEAAPDSAIGRELQNPIRVSDPDVVEIPGRSQRRERRVGLTT